MAWKFFNSSGQEIVSDTVADGSITFAKMAANSINSDQYVDGSIDRVHLAADIIDGTKIDDDVINSEHYVAGSIDNEHLADDAVGADELAANAVVNASIASSAAINFSKMENLTNSRLLVSDGSGDVSVSAVTAAEILQLSGLSVNVTDTNLNALTAGSGNTTLHSHAATDISCRAYHDTNQSTANNTVITLAFNQERFDTDTIHDTLTNNSRLTCKTAGKYLVIGMAQWATNTTGRRRIAIALNGGGALEGYQEWDTSQVALTHGTATTIIDMDVDDWVTLEVYQTSGGALDVQTSTNQSPELMMVKVG